MGIPWLVQENPTIDWASGQVIVEKNGIAHTLPCYRQCQNNLTEEEDSEVNLISAKAFKRCLQHNSEEERAFLGIVRKVDEGTEVEQSGSPSDVEKLWRADLPSLIWEVLQKYKDIFPSELPKGIPPVRMGHEFKIDLEDETPPIHRPLYILSHLELEEAKNQITDMLEH